MPFDCLSVGLVPVSRGETMQTQNLDGLDGKVNFAHRWRGRLANGGRRNLICQVRNFFGRPARSYGLIVG